MTKNVFLQAISEKFIWYLLLLLTSVTYWMQCHTIGYKVIYCKCYGFERAIFTLRCFFTSHSFPIFPSVPRAGSLVSTSAGLHTAAQNIAPAQMFVWITQQSTNFKFSYEFYLNVTNIFINYLWRRV